LLTASASYAETEDSLKKEQNRDVLVELSAKVYGGNVYFKLLMLNESKPGIYSLTREYADGSIESVGIKSIAVNTINQPIWYSFVDKSETRPVSYRLVRVSNEVEVVSIWHCSEIENGICLDKTLATIE
jgi:hypothetical protein